MFNYKQKITGVTGTNCVKKFEILVPLKYVSNFWKTLEIPLNNCESNLILTWSKNLVIASKSTFTWDPKWTQIGLRFHFGVKFHVGVR